MGLLKRMKDPVRGTAKVVDVSGGDIGGNTSTRMRIRLILTAEGVPPTPVDYGTWRHTGQEPSVGDSIPVTIDRANPEKFEIEWTEIPKLGDVLHQQAELRERAMLAEMRGEPLPAGSELDDLTALQRMADEDVADARQIWKENLEQGFCTQEEYDKQMRELDENLRRAENS